MNQIHMEICEFCDAHALHASRMVVKFPHGIGEDEVLLSVVVPVWKCEACEEVYLAEGAEQRQNAAVAEYQGRMRPSEIRRLRERAGLTQVRFAEELGVGVASVKRWETGAMAPSNSLNRLLQNFERESTARGAGRQVIGDARWRTARPAGRRIAAGAFDFAMAA